MESAKSYRNVTIKLLQAGGNLSQHKDWWNVHEECDDFNYKTFLQVAPYQDCANSLILYTFNDKAFPPTLEWITGGG